VAVLRWVKINDYHARYMEPALPPAVLALLGVLLVPIARALGERAFQVVCCIAAVAVIGAGAIAFGAPAPGRIRGDLEALSPIAPEVVSLQCTHVAGDYWNVWPAVFLANELLHERGEERMVWGLSERARPTYERSRAIPPERLRVATVPGDPHLEEWLKDYGAPRLVEVARGEKISVLGPVTAPR
jgi:hypothetical protein